jgi:hypothetical protein
MAAAGQKARIASGREMHGTTGVTGFHSPQWPWMALRARLAFSARSGHGWHCGRDWLFQPAVAMDGTAGVKKAGEGTRTLDIQLGKLALYQLSYARELPGL